MASLQWRSWCSHGAAGLGKPHLTPAQSRFLMAPSHFGCLQGWRLLNLTGQLAPVTNHPDSKKNIFLCLRGISLLFYFNLCLSPCPWAEKSPVSSSVLPPSGICTHGWDPTGPSLLRAEQSQVSASPQRSDAPSSQPPEGRLCLSVIRWGVRTYQGVVYVLGETAGAAETR